MTLRDNQSEQNSCARQSSRQSIISRRHRLAILIVARFPSRLSRYIIEPYDKTLNDMGIEARRGWAKLVTQQMDLARVGGDTAIVLAGQNYRRHLNMALLDRFAEVEVPMSGLMLGQQLSWLSKH
ncbi:DUF6884 domain-containing protein [Bradyrhizobium canariense]|uniref:DUF6884 domain-containing protein n=1 Tax=Bradyrhizobium TaxID=374 RepID=UPI0013966742|nr:DUF6884 domain-containing protein [Bradyrhizobium canariense]